MKRFRVLGGSISIYRFWWAGGRGDGMRGWLGSGREARPINGSERWIPKIVFFAYQLWIRISPWLLGVTWWNLNMFQISDVVFIFCNFSVHIIRICSPIICGFEYDRVPGWGWTLRNQGFSWIFIFLIHPNNWFRVVARLARCSKWESSIL